jgi:hypothetical protein
VMSLSSRKVRVYTLIFDNNPSAMSPESNALFLSPFPLAVTLEHRHP